MAALLRQVRGRQIHSDAFLRKAKSDRSKGAAHPFFRFRNRRVCEPDNGQCRPTAGELDLDANRPRFDPMERVSPDFGHHVRPPFARKICAHPEPTIRTIQEQKIPAAWVRPS